MVAATAVSGGAYAESGQTTVTGDSSASVQVTNVINGSTSGGTSHTIIEKTVDGVTTREEEIKNFEPGEPIRVETSVEAVSGGKESVQTGTNEAASAEVATEIAVEASTTPEEVQVSASTTKSFVANIGSYIVQTISNLVSGFLNLFN